MGFEASWILVQIQALPLTYSVTMNTFFPGFRYPGKWSGRLLSSWFVMNVIMLAHVEYLAQA